MGFLIVILGLGAVYLPILIVCIHFALKKHGNPITGFMKKAMLGLIAFFIFLPCFGIAAYFLKLGGLFASTSESIIGIIGGFAFMIVLPPFIMAYTLQKIGPKFASQVIETTVWRKIGINAFVRFGIVLGFLLLIQRGLLGGLY